MRSCPGTNRRILLTRREFDGRRPSRWTMSTVRARVERKDAPQQLYVRFSSLRLRLHYSAASVSDGRVVLPMASNRFCRLSLSRDRIGKLVKMLIR